jgi:putative transposase
VRVYAFVEREKAAHPVRRMCRVLGVSPSGYWAWRRREPGARDRANAQLTVHIMQIHQASRGAYGALRVQAELQARGMPCGHNRVARLMRQTGLVGCHRRRFVRTTRRDPAAAPAPIWGSAPSAPLVQISSG